MAIAEAAATLCGLGSFVARSGLVRCYLTRRPWLRTRRTELPHFFFKKKSIRREKTVDNQTPSPLEKSDGWKTDVLALLASGTLCCFLNVSDNTQAQRAMLPKTSVSSCSVLAEQ